MEKTALQQHIEFLRQKEQEYKKLGSPRWCAFADAATHAESLLPTERDAIVEAHKAGYPFNNIHDAEQYYETMYGK